MKLAAFLVLGALGYISGSSQAASFDIPRGFRSIGPSNAISSAPTGLFPGFVVIEDVTSISFGSFRPTYGASHVAITCNGKVSILHSMASSESPQEALRLLNISESFSVPSEVKYPEVENDKELMALARSTCGLKSSTSRSNIEIPIAITKQDIIRIIPRTIQIKGDLREGWLHYVPIKEEILTTSDGTELSRPDGKKMTRTVAEGTRPSSKRRVAVSCKLNKLQIVEMTSYAANGSVLESVKSSSSFESIGSVVPGSVGEEIVNFVCNK